MHRIGSLKITSTFLNKRVWEQSYLYLIVVLTVVMFLAFLVPEIYAFANLQPFTWQNSWDKCTYFSYQSVLALRNQPGYFFLWIVGWLQELGIAGSTQALIFDCSLPALSVLFLYKTIRALQVDKATAIAYAMIIIFSSVLFNFCNPHIASNFPQTSHFDFFLVGWETYPSILRAPNPQFAYFLLALFSYLFVHSKTKRLLLLLIPIVFLYFFVFVPYVYLLSVFFLIYRTKFVNSIVSLVFVNLIIFIALASCVWVMFMLLGDMSAVIKHSGLLQVGSKPHLNLVGCFGLLIYCCLSVCGVIRKQDKQSYVLLTLILSSFAITNLQIINKFALDLKDFQDYGNSAIGGLIVALSLYIVSTSLQYRYLFVVSRVGSSLILLTIAKYTVLSQGFNLNTYNFLINLGPTITAAQWHKIQKDPLHAIIMDERLSEFLPFSSPMMLAPVFSYQYSYPLFDKQCSKNPTLAYNASQFVSKNCDANKINCGDLINRINKYFQTVKYNQDMPYNDSIYCSSDKYLNKNFYFIQPDYSHNVVSVNIIPSFIYHFKHSMKDELHSLRSLVRGAV